MFASGFAHEWHCDEHLNSPYASDFNLLQKKKKVGEKEVTLQKMDTQYPKY